MMFSELFDLREYLVNYLGVGCEIGDKDVGDSEYPFVKILLENEFTIFTESEKLLNIDLPVNLKIIVNKGNEIRALEVFEKLLLKANQFNKDKGHLLEGTGSPEYVDATKTFEISVLYNLKLRIHDTT